MKNLNDQFKIKKTTMRDLTPDEQNFVAGGAVTTTGPQTTLWRLTSAACVSLPNMH